MELLFLEPILKQNIWGGDRLHTEYGYTIPSNHTGECWAISAHPNGDCLIRNGHFKGIHLSELWKLKPELFCRPSSYPVPESADIASMSFPLMVKIIDARQDLSIQVHPDDTYAKIHEHGSLGKTECWYILDCDEDASIVIGHHAQTKKELETMIHQNRWSQFIRTIPIKKGDFFQINPGCVHAIKGGTLILETQQSSDITYRVYDYDRLADGKPRPLHLAQSLDVITVPFKNQTQEKPSITRMPGAVHTHLISCAYYSVDKYEIHGSLTLDFPAVFTNISILEGEGTIDRIPVHKGEHLIVPAGYGRSILSGNFTCITSTPENLPQSPSHAIDSYGHILNVEVDNIMDNMKAG